MRERRREFRDWVRANHPDLGGDPEVFAEGLTRWREVSRPSGDGRDTVQVYRAPRGPFAWITQAVRRRGRRRAMARRLR